MTKSQADNINSKLQTQNRQIAQLTAIISDYKAQIAELKLCYKESKVFADHVYAIYINSIDTVVKFKQHIYNLCSDSVWGASGVIIYRKNSIDTNLYVINLADYNMKMTSVYNWAPYNHRTKITLIPIFNKKRWKLNIPQHQNLGLHMYPYDGINNKNQKINW